MITEFWSLGDGEWTASGDHRFIKATLARQHGRANIAVSFDDYGNIVSVELIEEAQP